MIVVQATMWPGGQQAQSYEILNASITNQSPPGAESENYFANVLVRPQSFKGLAGYAATIEVADHPFHSGIAPLLMAILGSAHTPPEAKADGFVIPRTRQLTRVDLVDASQFEDMLREGVGR